ncbi:hypothetical protein RA086_00590 [Lactiplantibacillus sp. WILCCON 0030]|uniref:Extracellular protein n=1 Tax=Lactiplantibacillus brownii TaxID=3069269 RepID=A0ABU1A574_9LACO|nr:hypothetical protein [Lactiplantibacillus brownii]MDQ7936146.1 hypothetical protein [Lactiplantibacillus brownii]
MKKFQTLLATIALALPIAVTPLAPTATLVANAATTTKAKTATYTLVKAPTLKKVCYHVTRTGLTLEKASFTADRAAVTLAPTTTKLATKTTYTATKAIKVTAGKKDAKTTTYLLLKTTKGKTLGWIKATSLTAGAYKVPKAKTIKKVTKRAPKKTTANRDTTNPTTLMVTRKVATLKQTYRTKAATPYYQAAFAADRPVVTLTKAGTIKSGKTYRATKTLYAKTGTKAATHEYVFLTKAGWAATTNLKPIK